MKDYSSSSVLSLFILLFSFVLVTSCLEIYEPDEAVNATIVGKWQLVRIEEPIKTLAPATDTIEVWIEFKEANINPAQLKSGLNLRRQT
ncbi:hypothetical protein [Pontibacter harenae]|uniref:hypothetical protein n=1 Tax=Pontibacter harenae TaxID=2894083 RepID=UPI001E57C0B4|nr:hypothetical protein [Pontibacter harenae]MCC9166170.1 hypothetical protein [Pontibacter harenae]